MPLDHMLPMGLFDKSFRKKHGFALFRDMTSNYFILLTFSYFLLLFK